MDRPRGQRNPDETEREVVRTLLGKPKAKKKKKKGLQQMVWLQALGILILLAGVVAVLAIVLQPPSADKLYRQAEKLMASTNPDSHDRAYDGPIKEYLQRYGKLTTDQAKQVRKWADDYDVARYEKLLARHMTWVKKGGLAVGGDEAEKVAFKAAEAEDVGDAEKAIALWNKAREAAPSHLGELARRHLEMLEGIDKKQKDLLALRLGILNDRKEPTLDAIPRQAFLGLRQEQLGDHEVAKRRYEQLKEAADKEEGQRFWRLFATVKQKQMADKLKKTPQDKKARVELVRKVVDDARSQSLAQWLKSRAAAHEIELLYEKEEDMAEVVKEAKALVKQIDAKLEPISSK